jgi:hypothetical protein
MDENQIEKVNKNTAIQTIDPNSPAGIMERLMKKDGTLDVEGFGKMLVFQEQYEANQARKAYHVAMTAFHLEAPKIIKTKQGHNCKHADLAVDLVAVVAPKLSSNGLSHSWGTKTEGDKITVTCKITHVLGHSEETTLSAGPDTSGSKNAIQAVGSTITYLQRYTLKAALGLAEAGQDDDGNDASDNEVKLPEITDQNKKVLAAICVILEMQIPDDMQIDPDKLAKKFLANGGSYPSKMGATATAAKWISDLDCMEDWTTKRPKENHLNKPGEKVMDLMQEAFIAFKDYHAGTPGIEEADFDFFMNETREAFGKLPTVKSSIPQICEKVKPEDVIPSI